MLTELSIRDLALIESLELELGAGLNVLTGETGAGKSLLVGALEFLRGETPRGGAAQWVRQGCKEARVEGRFELGSVAVRDACARILREEVPAVAKAWEEALEELEPGETAELILGRTLSKDGRTRAHIHQRPVPLRALRTLAPELLEIHGQNDHQQLFDPVEQVHLLDHYGCLQEDLARYTEAVQAWSELSTRLSTLRAQRAERRDKGDLLRFQISELEGAELEAGEHARLAEERELLRVAGDVRTELGTLTNELAESDGALVDRVRSAVKTVERWKVRLASLAGPLEDLHNAEIHLGEAAAALRTLVDGVSDDPGRLESVEERLAELERLETKYRMTESALVARIEEERAELQELEAAEESLASLEEEIEAAESVVLEADEKLHARRKALVPGLVKAVEGTLASLGLAKASFDVRFSAEKSSGDAASYPALGRRRVEFLLAANAGEPTAPLRDVASGGEAARIMLALRTVLEPKNKSAPKKSRAGLGRTLVFDEIDAGVGGRLGPEVGKHLRELGRREQVLCVTHTPAIAALADLHLYSKKEVQGGRTRTTIASLDEEGRVREVADMIAGGSDHATARAEARRLLSLSAG